MSTDDLAEHDPPSARLRRGVRIVERADGRLQVGYRPEHAVLPRLPRSLSGGVRLVGDTPWQSTVAEALLHRKVPISSAAELMVSLADGEHDRHQADLRLLDDQPVMHLAVIDSRVRVGPFVVPGVSACLRCLDAHAMHFDPGHAQVLEAYQQPGPVSAPPPAVLHWAVAWLVSDIVRWLTGWQPTTYSGVVWCDETSMPVLTEIERHPWCGCSWPSLWRRPAEHDSVS